MHTYKRIDTSPMQKATPKPLPSLQGPAPCPTLQLYLLPPLPAPTVVQLHRTSWGLCLCNFLWLEPSTSNSSHSWLSLFNYVSAQMSPPQRSLP